MLIRCCPKGVDKCTFFFRVWKYVYKCTALIQWEQTYNHKQKKVTTKPCWYFKICCVSMDWVVSHNIIWINTHIHTILFVHIISCIVTWSLYRQGHFSIIYSDVLPEARSYLCPCSAKERKRPQKWVSNHSFVCTWKYLPLRFQEKQ